MAPAADPTAELAADVFCRGCPSRTALGEITGKWGALALVALADGSYRFNALRRRVDGVSEKMLAQTLQALERDGLVERHAQTTIPPHVDYNLTELGVEIAEQLRAVLRTIELRLPLIMAARAAHGVEPCSAEVPGGA
jgi:DNA-binding HxlR family transcriptional regulator